jgi:hypothetical protein
MRRIRDLSKYKPCGVNTIAIYIKARPINRVVRSKLEERVQFIARIVIMMFALNSFLLGLLGGVG